MCGRRRAGSPTWEPRAVHPALPRPNIWSIAAAVRVTLAAIWCRYTSLVTVELTWPVASAIASMSIPASDSTDTKVCRCSWLSLTRPAGLAGTSPACAHVACRRRRRGSQHRRRAAARRPVRRVGRRRPAVHFIDNRPAVRHRGSALGYIASRRAVVASRPGRDAEAVAHRVAEYPASGRPGEGLPTSRPRGRMEPGMCSLRAASRPKRPSVPKAMDPLAGQQPCTDWDAGTDGTAERPNRGTCSRCGQRPAGPGAVLCTHCLGQIAGFSTGAIGAEAQQ